MEAAYLNNISANFGNVLRSVVNFVLDVNQMKICMRNELGDDGVTEDETHDTIRDVIKDSAKLFKMAIATGSRVLSDATDFGNFRHHWETFNFFFDSYPLNAQFGRRSVYFDVKVTPERHYKAYFNLARLTQGFNSNGNATFQCFPMKTSNYPIYTQIDTLIFSCVILRLTCDDTAARLRRVEDKRALYNRVFDLESDRFKD